MITFTVTDTGIGMSNRQQQQLFQPFTQGDTSTTKSMEVQDWAWQLAATFVR